MGQVHLACGLPFCQKPQEAQTNLSIGLRITAVALGILAIAVGALIFLNTPGLSHWGTTVGWTLVSLGAFLVSVGISIRCVKNQSNKSSEKESKSRIDENQNPETKVDKDEKENTLESNNSVNNLTNEEARAVEPNTPEQQILSDFTPQMVDALGGVDEVLALPVIDWNGSMNPEELTAPVTRGYQNGRPFLLFCYFRYSVQANRFDIACDYLSRKDSSWGTAKHCHSELDLSSNNSTFDNTLAAQHMLDKIARLMKGEAIGAIERFPGAVLVKPNDDKETWRPTNAYLEGEELEQFMDLDTLFYERKPPKGTTELFLYDPRISREENVKLYCQKFPQEG